MASVFDAGVVMTVKVERLKEAQARLGRAEAGLSPSAMQRPMVQATTLVHRYLLGLKRSGTPPTLTGVLPVATGRLAASFFWRVRRQGNGLIGIVGSNVDYGPQVEYRRQFLSKTVENMSGPVADIFGAHIRQIGR